jgi:hypothetical protein
VGGKTRIENRRNRIQSPILELRVIFMATIEASFLQGQLEERKRRLEVAVASAPQNSGLAGLLREVDSALDRMTEGTYGLCLECHDSVERDRLLADPLFLETEFCAAPVQLEAGDPLFLYTDGLSEASNESEEYGVDRVMTLVHQHAARQPAELIDACLNDVRAFTNSAPSFDDMTVLALRRCG